MEHYKLNNGLVLPAIGFGTYSILGDAMAPAVTAAVEAGYRLFDTASFYENEEALGASLRQTGLKREDYLISSKCWRTQMGYEGAIKAFLETLQKLKTDYVDAYLIHCPRPNLTDPDWPTICRQTWKALESIYAQGQARAIGISNFLPHHLEVLMEEAKITPAINQLEIHPGYSQPEARAVCKGQGILVEAWSPLGRMRGSESMLLSDLAKKYGVTLAQLCLRYDLQKGTLPIPKTTNPKRMAENRDVFGFTLSDEDVAAIDAMPITGWSGEHPDRERVMVQ